MNQGILSKADIFQQIIKAAIQAQDYEALEDFLSVDDLIVNEITSEVT